MGSVYLLIRLRPKWWQVILLAGLVSIFPMLFVFHVQRHYAIVIHYIVLALLILVAFYTFERAKERRDGDPLFEFSQLQHPGFRYGLQTTTMTAMGQFGFLLVIPVLLQDLHRRR